MSCARCSVAVATERERPAAAVRATDCGDALAAERRECLNRVRWDAGDDQGRVVHLNRPVSIDFDWLAGSVDGSLVLTVVDLF